MKMSSYVANRNGHLFQFIRTNLFSQQKLCKTPHDHSLVFILKTDFGKLNINHINLMIFVYLQINVLYVSLFTETWI